MKARIALAFVAVIASIGMAQPTAVADHGNAAEAFETTWQRTDLPVLSAVAQRTWIWGPEPATAIMHEPYLEADTGQRSVQYYDKSRMEVNNADGNQDAVWYVTNGLLVVEMMTGRLQVGDTAFEPRAPAEVNVAGDATDAFGPTYRTIAEVAGEPPAPLGTVVTQRLARSGTISIDASLGNQNVQIAEIAQVTGHGIARPFWDFMNASGTVYTSGTFQTDLLFENPYFATGYPVSEPYWADVSVGGMPKLVLLQCFERRCLTYTPDNAPEWRVEAGNVGLHYYAWRYGDGAPTPGPGPDPATDACEPGSGSDFAGQELTQPDFMGQDLSCAVFTDATVEQGNFSDADATRADFSNAELLQPTFRNTTLVSADFSDAFLDHPIFDGADVEDADFEGATLDQPIFDGANLLGAALEAAELIMPAFTDTICPNGENSDDAGGTCLDSLSDDPGGSPPPACTPGDGPDYSGQDLTQADFTGQDLACATFVGASVSQGDFTDVNASYADFSASDLSQPAFTRTNLVGAVFVDAELTQPVFVDAAAIDANFANALLSQPIFQDTILLSANLSTATLSMPQFINTTCPDSTNSDDNGGTCIGHLDPIPPPSP